jgi:uncharacterized protein YggE
MTRASRAIESFIDAARKAGVAEKDLRTQTVSVSPVYQRTNNDRNQRPEISGYSAQQRLRVTVRKIEMAGEILDTLVKAGANEVGGISFSVTKRAILVDEARKKAVAATRHAADILAAEAGLRLGAAFKIVEQSSSPAHLRQERMMSTASSRVPVSPGEILVSVRVRVVFYLVNAAGTK